MHETLTRNIAKSGEVLNWSRFSPFQLYLGLKVNHSQSASCHIATVIAYCKDKHKQLNEMILKRILLVFFTTLISSALYSQHGLRLDKTIKLDTLRIWVNYPADFEKDMIMRFDSIFESTVSRLNEEVSFFVEIDSVNPNNRILMNMESIKYVDTKRNILSTGLSLILVGGHVFMISTYGWTIPIWPILLPATVSKVNLHIDQNMITSKPESRTWISSNGYFMKKEKQSRRFERKFDKDIYKYVKSIDRQNVKNNKL